MFIGLKDFDIDIFLKLDDDGIFIYYVDFETIPKLIDYVPLGSFDNEGKILLKTLPMQDRIDIGLAFMHRDFFAEYADFSLNTLIRVDRFLEQFGNIPEVVEFFEPYMEQCSRHHPASWCTECPDSSDPNEKCAISVPVEEFIKYKGELVKEWGVHVRGAQLESDDNIVTIKAVVSTVDSDGAVYTAEDNKTFDLNGLSQLSQLAQQIPTTSGNPNTELRSIYNTPDDCSASTDLTINAIPKNKDRTPTFSGTVVNSVYNKINLKITKDGDPEFEEFISEVATVAIDPSASPTISTWQFTIPEAYKLSDGEYTIEISTICLDGTVPPGSPKIPKSVTAPFEIDNNASIIITEYSNGYIGINEYTSPLIIGGDVDDVEEGQPVSITFNQKEYQCNVMNSKFEVTIPGNDVNQLRDNQGYTIFAETLDLLGNVATDTQSLYVDLIQPSPTITINPDITSQLLQDTIDNNGVIAIDGIVGGDAIVGDNVFITINGIPFTTYVREEMRIPSNPEPSDIDYSDLYYLIILYFNGIYRTHPDYAQESGTYKILTDIDFDLNNYTMILNIKEFFTKEFIYFLKCLPGSLPFGNDYGTNIKLAVQTKNFIVRQLEVQSEIRFFIEGFNSAYGGLVKLRDINLISQESDIGADTWVVEVYADIQKERLVYRLEI